MPGSLVTPVTSVSAVTAAPGTASTTNALNANAEANQLTNAISNAKGGSSSGSADSTAAETLVPFPALASYVSNHTATQVSHQGGLVAATISFNLPPGGSLSKATDAINQASQELGLPASIHGSFAGAAQVYAQSMSTMPLLILAALAAVYIVLGMLYENTVHPITILVHPAIGGYRRHPGAADLRHAVLGDRDDRHHPVDRHRQEERDHDDRRRHSPAARRRL